jgi:hypothetical protein
MRHEMNEDRIGRIPDFFLEQYRLGEADPETAARVEADPDALRRLAEIDADTTLHFERYPADWFVAEVRRKAAATTTAPDGSAVSPKTADADGHRGISLVRSGSDATGAPSRSGRIRAFVADHPFALPGLAAAVIVLALLPYQLLLRSEPSLDDTAAIARGERVKGLDTSLLIFRNTPDGAVEELTDGTPVAAGDHLQIAYVAAGRSHGMIFSVDGNGVVTLHYPDFPGGPSELVQGGSTALPFAYVLDDAPRYEEFYFLTAPEAVPTAEIITQVESDPDPEAITALLRDWAARDEERDYQRLSLPKQGGSN